MRVWSWKAKKWEGSIKSGMYYSHIGVNISMEILLAYLSMISNINKSNPFVIASKENKEDSDKIYQEKDPILQQGQLSLQIPIYDQIRS